MRIPACMALAMAAALPALAQPLQPPQPPPDPPPVALPAELDRVLRDYERAWRAKDPAALAELFTEDGFVMANGAAPARGREAIRKIYAGQGGALFLRAFAFGRDGDVGFILGGYAGREGAPDEGKFTLTLRRGADGRWRIFSDMDNPNRRPAPPAAPEPPPPAAAGS
jgi:ketosteroid isomerase-like protein